MRRVSSLSTVNVPIRKVRKYCSTDGAGNLIAMPSTPFVDDVCRFVLCGPLRRPGCYIPDCSLPIPGLSCCEFERAHATNPLWDGVPEGERGIPPEIWHPGFQFTRREGMIQWAKLSLRRISF